MTQTKKKSPTRATKQDSYESISPRGEQKKSPKAQQQGPDRECMINYSDNPGVIHRGEILPFHTKKPNEK